MQRNLMLPMLKNQRGVSAIVVAIALVVLIGFAALAVDLAYLFAARNELQNAADAGALAGASALYRDTGGELVDPNANEIAADAARANKSQKGAVDLLKADSTEYVDTNNCEPDDDVVRGHWSFGLADPNTRGFTCNNSLDVPDLTGFTAEQLDADTNFINAVRVVARRSSFGTPLWSFFSRIFGYQFFEVGAEAVAYIGFASDLAGVDLPIAICADSIIDAGSGEVDCTIGRMFTGGDTARWTTLAGPEEGSTNDNDVRDLVASTCGSTESGIVETGASGEIATSNGQLQNSFKNLYNCWKLNALNAIPESAGSEEKVDVPIDSDESGDGHCFPDQPWLRTLPVIVCESPTSSSKLISIVEISFAWMVLDKNSINGEAGPCVDDKELGAPKEMCYEVPAYDGAGCTTWPYDANPEGLWPNTDPEEEIIDGTGLPEGEPSILEILQSFDLPPNKWDQINTEITAAEGAGWETNPVEDLFDYGAVRWASFVKHFNLLDAGGDPAEYEQKTIYFLPSCKIIEPTGVSGPDNFGVLAEFPVLVE